MDVRSFNPYNQTGLVVLSLSLRVCRGGVVGIREWCTGWAALAIVATSEDKEKKYPTCSGEMQ